MTNRTDDFNRADSSSALGTPSDAGSAWVALAGTWGIVSNAAYKVANAATYEAATLESSVSDVDVEVTLTQIGAAAAGGLVARATDNSNYIMTQHDAGGGNIYLFKRVAGSFTQLGSTYSGGIIPGDVLKLTCNGSSLTVYKNGVSIITATDSAGSTNTKHGLFSHTAGTTDSPRFDTFSITGLGGGGGAAPSLASRKLLLGVGA
jgi:hypothetical protein